MYVVWRLLAAALAVFFGLVVWMGFRANLGTANTHIASAFFMVICLLFLHSLCIFYLIGSGRDIREAVAHKPWGAPWVRLISRQRLVCFPWALASMMAGIVAAWIGAAAHTNVVSTMTHRVTAIGALALNLFAFFVEYGQLKSNSRMIAECNRKLREEAPAEEAQLPTQ